MNPAKISLLVLVAVTWPRGAAALCRQLSPWERFVQVVSSEVVLVGRVTHVANGTTMTVAIRAVLRDEGGVLDASGTSIVVVTAELAPLPVGTLAVFHFKGPWHGSGLVKCNAPVVLD